MKKILLAVSVLLLVLSVNFSAFAGDADYSKAVKKYFNVTDGKEDTKVALDALLPTYSDSLSLDNRFHSAFYIGDLYFRLGDYPNAKEWLLKCIENKEFYNIPVKIRGGQELHKHGLAAAVILAAAAAEFGKPDDIDLLESKIPQKELSSRVLVWYCWTSQSDKRSSMRTLLQFYKALAYKNAGNLDAMKKIVEMSSFRSGFVRIGNKVLPIEEAVNLLK